MGRERESHCLFAARSLREDRSRACPLIARPADYRPLATGHRFLVRQAADGFAEPSMAATVRIVGRVDMGGVRV